MRAMKVEIFSLLFTFGISQVNPKAPPVTYGVYGSVLLRLQCSVCTVQTQ